MCEASLLLPFCYFLLVFILLTGLRSLYCWWCTVSLFLSPKIVDELNISFAKCARGTHFMLACDITHPRLHQLDSVEYLTLKTVVEIPVPLINREQMTNGSES
ncbi:hypothetical protein G7K_4001-t1 [Saitoella complicata NRRL Y-17804]|uniref:Uncharacterized protein n=1 Tax=Saitoella complicata (strain BCRC 22490 / CBS 7301 / JCM 7358 / NBRC 10748 / NRRL Y-17804) TaxID=698492 RepID=A0A0E9NJ52_SAICN|nr:hypothetical protein G7K_4001-t1 [Saitoella complicata NRRL Y-17804]